MIILILKYGRPLPDVTEPHSATEKYKRWYGEKAPRFFKHEAGWHFYTEVFQASEEPERPPLSLCTR
jgi:hypothetical protein